MRKTTVYSMIAAIALLAVSALALAQSSPARRTPALTNDDLAPAAREAPPVASDPLPSRKSDRDAVSFGIEWRRDLESAFEDARRSGKVVVADVYTDWCGWCKKMDQKIYSDPTIVALSRQHVFLKLNAEDRGQGQSFAAQMRVKGYPTTIVLDGNGRVLNVARGYIESPRAFADFVEQARASQGR